MAPTETNHGNPSGKTFFGQPRMPANMFSVELGERFSFYGLSLSAKLAPRILTTQMVALLLAVKRIKSLISGVQ